MNKHRGSPVGYPCKVGTTPQTWKGKMRLVRIMKIKKFSVYLLMVLGAVTGLGSEPVKAQNPPPKSELQESPRLQRKLAPRPRDGQPKVDVWLQRGCNAIYYPGEEVIISFRTNQSGYVTIYDVDTRGEVKVFFPNRYHPDNYVNANQTYRIPDREYGYDLIVEGPPGTEYIQAVFSLDSYYHWNYNHREPDWVYNWGLRGETFKSESNERRYTILKERVNTNLTRRLREEPRDDRYDDRYRDYDTRECFFQVAERGRYTPSASEDEYLNRQRRELERIPELRTRREGGRLIVTMPNSILFDTNSTALGPGSRDRLNRVSDVLNRYPRTNVVIEGHTDSVGSESYNLRLSEERAASVADYLVSQGVERYRITTIGYGESRPVASNATPEGRLQNRRVELSIWVDRARFQAGDLPPGREERPRY